MERCRKHDWKQHPTNPKKVVCGACGAEQYKSKLTPKQLEALRASERPELKVKPVDLLMFVGRSFYSPESFIDEARRLGVCKRVPTLPRGVVKGVTRVFLAHEDALPDKSGVFAYFVVRGMSFIVPPGLNIPEALRERGVTEYEYVGGGFGFSDERGCGSLAIGGTYLLSEEGMEKCRDLAKSATLEGRIEVIDPPVPTGLRRFRGYKHVIGDYILERRPEAEWYGEAHQIYLENKRAMRKYKRELRKWKEMQEASE